MIVHVHVPIHRNSLAPDKIAAWLGEMLDPERDFVQAVTVTDPHGEVLVWTDPSVATDPPAPTPTPPP